LSLIIITTDEVCHLLFKSIISILKCLLVGFVLGFEGQLILSVGLLEVTLIVRVLLSKVVFSIRVDIGGGVTINGGIDFVLCGQVSSKFVIVCSVVISIFDLLFVVLVGIDQLVIVLLSLVLEIRQGGFFIRCYINSWDDNIGSIIQKYVVIVRDIV
jgi:hypothetical protein